jgi:hypothetical protein
MKMDRRTCGCRKVYTEIAPFVPFPSLPTLFYCNYSCSLCCVAICAFAPAVVAYLVAEYPGPLLLHVFRGSKSLCDRRSVPVLYCQPWYRCENYACPRDDGDDLTASWLSSFRFGCSMVLCDCRGFLISVMGQATAGKFLFFARGAVFCAPP